MSSSSKDASVEANFIPRTKIGRLILEARQNMVANTVDFLTDDQIDAEISIRKGRDNE